MVKSLTKILLWAEKHKFSFRSILTANYISLMLKIEMGVISGYKGK
jgi:hypothetical protein